MKRALFYINTSGVYWVQIVSQTDVILQKKKIKFWEMLKQIDFILNEEIIICQIINC